MDVYDEPGRSYRGWSGDGEMEMRGTGDLVKELFAELRILIKEELRLAKAEARAEAKKVAVAGTGFGAGAVLLFVAFLAFAAFLVALGDTFLPLWVSALCVAGLFALCGGVALAAGKSQLKTLEPARPVKGLKEEAAWAKDTMQGIRSRKHANA
jgi:hypothetical protein